MEAYSYQNDNPQEIIDNIKQKYTENHSRDDYEAFYSSELGCITKNKTFMCVNLSEKAISRGYYVCKRIQVRDNKIYLNDKHNKLIDNATKLGLSSPLDANKIEKLITALHQASELSDCEIIVYITGGIGDQGIYIDELQTAVYGVAIKCPPKPKDIDKLVLSDTLEMPNMDTVKKTNYICNSYAASASKSRNGYLGIMLDSDDNILEASMANVGVVLDNGVFHLPSFDKTVAGTTALFCIQHIENNLIPSGVIKEISREDITAEQVKLHAKEVMLFGGKKVVPILKLDGHEISKEAGEVAHSLQEFLKNIETGHSDTVPLTPFKIDEN